MGFNWVLPNFTKFHWIIIVFPHSSFLLKCWVWNSCLCSKVPFILEHFCFEWCSFFSFLTRNCCYLEDLRVRIWLGSSSSKNRRYRRTGAARNNRRHGATDRRRHAAAARGAGPVRRLQPDDHAARHRLAGRSQLAQRSGSFACRAFLNLTEFYLVLRQGRGVDWWAQLWMLSSTWFIPSLSITSFLLILMPSFVSLSLPSCFFL